MESSSGESGHLSKDNSLPSLTSSARIHNLEIHPPTQRDASDQHRSGVSSPGVYLLHGAVKCVCSRKLC